MNNAQLQTLDYIFKLRSDLTWGRVKSMLQAVCEEVTYNKGASCVIRVNGKRLSFHHPHGEGRAMHPLCIKTIRNFLVDVGITPNTMLARRA